MPASNIDVQKLYLDHERLLEENESLKAVNKQLLESLEETLKLINDNKHQLWLNDIEWNKIESFNLLIIKSK